jgi:hypothetical protein
LSGIKKHKHMKNLISPLLVLLTLLFLTCEKDESDPDISSKITITTAEATDIDYRNATVSGTLGDTYDHVVQDYGHCWDTLQDPDITKSKTAFGSTKGGKTFTSQLSDLAPDKQYFIRAYFTIDDITVYSTAVFFGTRATSLPI